MPSDRMVQLVKAYRANHPEMTDEEERLMLAEAEDELGDEEAEETWLDNLSANASKLAALPPEAREYAARYVMVESMSPERRTEKRIQCETCSTLASR
jgi:hypothetical protein